jgi:hypothetical protein
MAKYSKKAHKKKEEVMDELKTENDNQAKMANVKL